MKEVLFDLLNKCKQIGCELVNMLMSLFRAIAKALGKATDEGVKTFKEEIKEIKNDIEDGKGE